MYVWVHTHKNYFLIFYVYMSTLYVVYVNLCVGVRAKKETKERYLLSLSATFAFIILRKVLSNILGFVVLI